MKLVNFAIKNAFRGKLRLFLVFLLILVIIGVSFTVIFLQLSGELFQSFSLDTGGGDFHISANNTSSHNTFSMSELNNIQAIPGVNEGLGVSIYLIRAQNPIKLKYAVLNGVNKKIVNDSRVPVVGHIRLIKGRLLTEGTHEILITKTFAKNMNLNVGDTIPITHMASKEVSLENFNKYPIKSKSPFTVVGIINDIPNEGIISLNVANELIYNSSDLKFDFINVKQILTN
ncbi:MAG: ABC transporter permease [Methanobacterium sp.]|nr:ABC transporter permease [Methanobacterium sp.]